MVFWRKTILFLVDICLAIQFLHNWVIPETLCSQDLDVAVWNILKGRPKNFYPKHIDRNYSLTESVYVKSIMRDIWILNMHKLIVINRTSITKNILWNNKSTDLCNHWRCMDCPCIRLSTCIGIHPLVWRWGLGSSCLHWHMLELSVYRAPSRRTHYPWWPNQEPTWHFCLQLDCWSCLFPCHWGLAGWSCTWIK